MSTSTTTVTETNGASSLLLTLHATNQEKVQKLIQEIKQSQYIESSILDAWYQQYQNSQEPYLDLCIFYYEILKPLLENDQERIQGWMLEIIQILDNTEKPQTSAEACLKQYAQFAGEYIRQNGQITEMYAKAEVFQEQQEGNFSQIQRLFANQAAEIEDDAQKRRDSLGAQIENANRLDEKLQHQNGRAGNLDRRIEDLRKDTQRLHEAWKRV